MFKAFIIISLAVLGNCQLNIPGKTATLGQWAQQVIAGPAPIAIAQAPVGQLPIPISRIRTQEVLPIQDLGTVNAGPQVVQVRSEQEPVLVHYQTQSAPIKVETSHVPSPPGQVEVTQSQDEPHHVIHEVIRPVIQEVREIIQPYRRVTQEIRPVQEEVHTDVAANAGGAVAAAPARINLPAPQQVAVAAPAQVTVAQPVQTVVRQPIAVAQPAQSVWGANRGLGLIQAPAPLLTGSYIHQFLEGLRARNADQNFVISRPALTINAPEQKVAIEAGEPIAAEAAALVPQNTPAVTRRVGTGAATITRKYVEY